tara:strand:+ start:284 stop:712 length:429 start_codon:yes stop_codon:yes gene_type:complete
MRKTFHQMFSDNEKLKSRKDKVEHLRSCSSPGLKAILGFTYDPNVKWLLPEGTPPFTPNTISDNEGQLEYESRKFYLFVEGPSEQQQNLKKHKREELFINMLETVSHVEAKILLGMKERKLPYKGITKKLVAEAFPNLASNW